jgi:hypothetical protein
MRKFNTSGPNYAVKHYTIKRKGLIEQGIEMVRDERYFTIWAPRQTGKSTYFRQLATELQLGGYKVVHLNVENYLDATKKVFLNIIKDHIFEQTGIKLKTTKTYTEFEQEVRSLKEGRCVLIIDEIEGLNPEIFGQFLHTIRNLYHSREKHCLKSVILVGVTNIVGVVSDNASPFNIVDNLNVPYFTNKEVFELIGQHEKETGQMFETKVKEKICQITANQPGLVNGFAKKLVDDNPDKKRITYNDYLKVEDWYLTEAIDKNFENIHNKAKEERNLVERLLFTEDEIPFKVDRPGIKLLHTNGLIKKDKNGFVTFWVPFYKKRLYDAFYPYTNGEKADILRSFAIKEHFDENNKLIFDKLIDGYKEYVRRRGFNAFREKDEKGSYKSIKESALIYSFETYIQAFLQVVGGKSYREADTGLGKSDLTININSEEYLVETKIYYYEKQFTNGKKQLAYYCKNLGLDKGVYLVFCPNNIKYNDTIKEDIENIEKVQISTYLISYDETKW